MSTELSGQRASFEQFTCNGWGFEQESLNLNSLVYHFPSTYELKALLGRGKPAIVPLHFCYDYTRNRLAEAPGAAFCYDYFLLNKQVQNFIENKNLRIQKTDYYPILTLGTQVLTFTFCADGKLSHYVFPFSTVLLSQMWFIDEEKLSALFLAEFAAFLDEALADKAAAEAKAPINTEPKRLFVYNEVSALNDEAAPKHKVFLELLQSTLQDVVTRRGGLGGPGSAPSSLEGSAIIYNAGPDGRVEELDMTLLRTQCEQLGVEAARRPYLQCHARFYGKLLSHAYSTPAHCGLGHFTSFTYYNQMLLNQQDPDYENLKKALKNEKTRDDAKKSVASFISEGVVKVTGSSETFARFPFPLRKDFGELEFDVTNPVEYLNEHPEAGEKGELMWILLGVPVIRRGKMVDKNEAIGDKKLRQELQKRQYIGLAWFNKDYLEQQEKGMFQFNESPLTFIKLPYSDVIKE